MPQNFVAWGFLESSGIPLHRHLYHLDPSTNQVKEGSPSDGHEFGEAGFKPSEDGSRINAVIT